MDPIGRTRALFFLLLVWAIFTLNIIYSVSKSTTLPNLTRTTFDPDCPNATKPVVTLLKEDGSFKTYNRSSPLIFVGGLPRSGTTLLRAILDVHSLIHCGMETGVIGALTTMVSHWIVSAKESARLNKAGITDEVLDDAVASFILEIMAKHGDHAERLCNSDPFNLQEGRILQKVFPNSKFIFLIRDGRAVVHSIISRNIPIPGYNLTSPEKCLKTWSGQMKTLFRACQRLGKSCLKVKYEELVLFPQTQMKRILEFLEVPWENRVLHHHKYINKLGGAYLSKLERSTFQVKKAIYTKAISSWVGKFPKQVTKKMDILAPMLKVLGYDPMANPPNYFHPDPDSKVDSKLLPHLDMDEGTEEFELYPEEEF